MLEVLKQLLNTTLKYCFDFKPDINDPLREKHFLGLNLAKQYCDFLTKNY